MTDFDRILTSTPVNSQAARQMGRGEHWEPATSIHDYFADRPPMKAINRGQSMNPEFRDWTGFKVGRLTVLGLWADKSGGRAGWVCRCACGGFCTRTSKSLSAGERNSNSFHAMCGRCSYVDKLRSGSLRFD